MNEQVIFLLILGAGWHTNLLNRGDYVYRWSTPSLALDETSYLYVSRINSKIKNSNGYNRE